MTIMQVLALFFVSGLTGVFGIPPALDDRPSPPNITSARDHAFLMQLHTNRASLGSNFKFKYIGEGGVISSRRHSTGYWFELAATVAVSETAHQKGAEIISRMTKHMPRDIFERLAAHANAGIFTEEEHLSVYPEFKDVADTPECHHTCSGHCQHTCTFDGRKYETLAGVGGRRAVVVDDNILCNHNDAYRHHYSVLIHEFTHTIHAQAISSYWKGQISSAYDHAKSHHIWPSHSYAMSNSHEYLAQGSGTFFNADHITKEEGRMNMCSGRMCSSEHAMRENLRSKDPQLFAVLSHVFTSDQPSIPSGLGTCI